MWLVMLLVVAGAVVFTYRYAHRQWYSPSMAPHVRVEVIEDAPFDAKRRLVLVRRDDVEHLILTGGPVDVVIETGITPPAPHPHTEPAAFNRPNRTAPAPARKPPSLPNDPAIDTGRAEPTFEGMK